MGEEVKLLVPSSACSIAESSLICGSWRRAGVPPAPLGARVQAECAPAGTAARSAPDLMHNQAARQAVRLTEAWKTSPVRQRQP